MHYLIILWTDLIILATDFIIYTSLLHALIGNHFLKSILLEDNAMHNPNNQWLGYKNNLLQLNICDHILVLLGTAQIFYPSHL